MKFLVIGASGFVGRNILYYLKAKGFDALGTQARSQYSNMVKFDLIRDRIHRCIDASFFQDEKTVFVIICACISQVDRCFREQEISYKVNVVNTIQLIQDIEDLGAHPVFMSSSFVFDGNDGYYVEESPRNPICEYGLHKAAVEDFLKKNVSDGLILRLDKIVGDNPLEKHLFSEWVQCLNENRHIVCIKEQLFSPTYVLDIGRAVLHGCADNLTGLYHIANQEYFSRSELAAQFVKATGRKAEIVEKLQSEFDFLDFRPLKTYLDANKFIETTGMNFTSMRKVLNNYLNKVYRRR